MSLTCTLETYLRFKGRKWCKLNHFKFWKIKKGLNEEISESRLMNHEKRKDEDIMSLEYEKWPLWSKKEGNKTWKMNHEARLSYMKIWNSKFDGNIHSELEEKFGVLYKVHFRHTIYLFEAWEVKSPTLQIVYKSKLKWRSYGHLKTIVQNWRAISKWFWNATYEFETQFEMTPISNSPTASSMFRLLYLGNCIHGPKWASHD